jgi:hypothetical protein
MRPARFLLPLVSATLALSLTACASPGPEPLNRLPIPELPEGEWHTITGDPEAPVEEWDEGPELTQAEAIIATEKLAMPEGRFWDLIDLMKGVATEDSVTRLSERLAELGQDQVIAFEARLTLHLFALDTWDIAQQYTSHDDYFSDDGFLYTRCATVGAGRAAYERALATSTLQPDPADGEGENLLYVSMYAADIMGLDWEILHAVPLSAETGSNEDGWSEYDPDAGSTT